jgi:hypothetical protein
MFLLLLNVLLILLKQTQYFHLDEHDIMVSFDVVSLFTKILVPEALDIISKLVNSKTFNLIEIYLISTFFSFKGTFYEKTKGTTWDHPYPQW